RIGFSFNDGCAKRRQIGFSQIAFINGGVKSMSFGFGPAMHRIVFRGGDNLKVARIVTLQALHELNPKTPGEIWIFAVSLLSASPARVAKDIDVGTPERQALIAKALVLTHKLVMLGARFGRDNVSH